MTERQFRANVISVIAVYLVVIASALVVRSMYPEKDALPYNTIRDLIPLVLAIPAAWLVYCFQKRQAYLHDVRTLWTKMIAATQEAIQYTHLTSPDQQTFASVQKSLSSVIDELRGVFVNLGESRSCVGLYPFEGMKTILRIVSEIGYGSTVTKLKSDNARVKIVEEWKKLRRSFLSECARGAPIRPDSPYLEEKSLKVP